MAVHIGMMGEHAQTPVQVMMPTAVAPILGSTVFDNDAQP